MQVTAVHQEIVLLWLKEPLNMASDFEAESCRKDKECSARFAVVEERARPTLIRQTIQLLGIFKIERRPGELTEKI